MRQVTCFCVITLTVRLGDAVGKEHPAKTVRVEGAAIDQKNKPPKIYGGRGVATIWLL